MPYQRKSKEGCVGENMPAALKGERDGEGPISENYKGKLRNADPNYKYPPNPEEAQVISDYTKGHMKQRREETAQQKRANQN